MSSSSTSTKQPPLLFFLTVTELRALARRHRIVIKSRSRKWDIINRLNEKLPSSTIRKEVIGIFRLKQRRR